MTKTDNQAQIGMHVFERANLGKAPFRCVGYEEKSYRAHPDAPSQPGGSCDYCGTGIYLQCHIRGADGRTFKVGSDCVAKTGDAGLLKSFKNNPQVRAAARAKRDAKDARVKAEWATLVEANKEKLSAMPGAYGRTVYENFTWIFDRCGASGRARYLKNLKTLLAGA